MEGNNDYNPFNANEAQQADQVMAQPSQVQQSLSQNYDPQYFPLVRWKNENNQMEEEPVNVNSIKKYMSSGNPQPLYNRNPTNNGLEQEQQNSQQPNAQNDNPLQQSPKNNGPNNAPQNQMDRTYWQHTEQHAQLEDELDGTVTFKDMYGQVLGEYNRENILGQGAFGKVYVGTLKDGNKPVAVKRIEKEIFNLARSNYQWEQLEREVDALRNLQHRNLVAYEGHTRPSQNSFIIMMEYCEGGNLVDFYNRNRTILPIAYWFKALEDITRGLLAMHRQGFIHRDVKPENILIKQDPQTYEIVYKISDFGCSKRYDQNQVREQTLKVGTLLYQPPELIARDTGLFPPGDLSQRFDSVDVWSLGTLFYIMLSGGNHPFLESWDEAKQIADGFFGLTQRNVRQSAVKYRERMLTRFLPLNPLTNEQPQHDLILLIKKMLEPEPQNRPNVLQVQQELERIWNTYKDSPYWNLKISIPK